MKSRKISSIREISCRKEEIGDSYSYFRMIPIPTIVNIEKIYMKLPLKSGFIGKLKYTNSLGIEDRHIIITHNSIRFHSLLIRGMSSCKRPGSYEYKC